MAFDSFEELQEYAKVNGLLLVQENGLIVLLKVKPYLQLKVEDFDAVEIKQAIDLAIADGLKDWEGNGL